MDGRKVRGMLGHAVVVRSAATPGFQSLLGGCIILPVDSRGVGGAAREERAGSARSVPHNTNRLCKALIGPTIEQEAQSTLHVKVNLKVRRFY